MNIYDNSGKDITNNANALKEIGIYKFYVKKEVLDEILNVLKIKNCKNIEKYPYSKNGEEYFCIYVGQTKSEKGFSQRVIKENVNGSINVSTLKKSLKAILDSSGSNLNVKDIFDKKSIFVVTPISDAKILNQEKRNEINKDNCFRPLNIKNNYYKDDNLKNVKKIIKEARKNIK